MNWLEWSRGRGCGAGLDRSHYHCGVHCEEFGKIDHLVRSLLARLFADSTRTSFDCACKYRSRVHQKVKL